MTNLKKENIKKAQGRCNVTHGKVFIMLLKVLKLIIFKCVV